MNDYQHFVHYYETDKMGITHHSNYIRWMEEARMDFFKQLGYDYLEFEKLGIISPVVGLNNIKYKRPSTVGDIIDIHISVKSFNSIVLTIHYEMKKGGTLIFEGDSDHCFLSKEGKMIILGKDHFPDLNDLLKNLIEE